MARLIDEAAFKEEMGSLLHKGMMEAAEPIIQEVLQVAEREMRAKLAAMLVGYIESSYSMERDGRNLLIRVQLGKGESR